MTISSQGWTAPRKDESDAQVWALRHDERAHEAMIVEGAAAREFYSPVRIGGSSLSFRQPKSGAKRGESPTFYQFSKEDQQKLRLIASAPDLLEALIDAHAKLATILSSPGLPKALGGIFAGVQRTRDNARAVIAKATGE